MPHQTEMDKAPRFNHSNVMLLPVEGQQKEIQYPGWHGDTTGKELLSGEND